MAHAHPTTMLENPTEAMDIDGTGRVAAERKLLAVSTTCDAEQDRENLQVVWRDNAQEGTFSGFFYHRVNDCQLLFNRLTVDGVALFQKLQAEGRAPVLLEPDNALVAVITLARAQREVQHAGFGYGARHEKSYIVEARTDEIFHGATQDGDGKVFAPPILNAGQLWEPSDQEYLDHSVKERKKIVAFVRELNRANNVAKPWKPPVVEKSSTPRKSNKNKTKRPRRSKRKLSAAIVSSDVDGSPGNSPTQQVETPSKRSKPN